MDLIKIEKRVPGTLLLKFQDSQHYGNYVNVVIEYNQEFRLVPVNLVVGMFQIPSTLNAFKNGLWTMPQKDKEKVFKLATEMGLLYSGGQEDIAQPKVLYSETQIRDAVRLNRTTLVGEIIKKGNRSQKAYLVTIAKSEIANLKQRTVDLIEGGLGISLSEGVE
jgi:hypothetical protein